MPVKTLLSGHPHLSGEENEQIFNGVQTFIARSGRFTQGRLYHLQRLSQLMIRGPYSTPGSGLGMGWVPWGWRTDVILFSFSVVFGKKKIINITVTYDLHDT